MTRAVSGGAIEVRGVRWKLGDAWHEGPVVISGGRLHLPQSQEPAMGRTADLETQALVALPGLVNGHDHLDFEGFPLLASMAPYADYVQWAEDVTERRKRGELSAFEATPLARRLLAAALRNLASGVTAVAHMNPYVRRVFMRRDYPVRVLGEGRFYHSLAYGGDLGAFLRKVRGRRFMAHVAEGTSERARSEISVFASAGALSPRTLLVHGTALGAREAETLATSGATLCLCPRSNQTLYGAAPDMPMLARAGVPLALGSDSPISGPADLLEDHAAAIALGMTPEAAFRAITTVPAEALGAPELGTLHHGGPADVLFAPESDADLAKGKASVVLVLRGGRPLLSRRAGFIAALGGSEREVTRGLFLEERLAAWSGRLGIDQDGAMGTCPRTRLADLS